MKVKLVLLLFCVVSILGLISYTAFHIDNFTPPPRPKLICGKNAGPRYAKLGDAVLAIPQSIEIFTFQDERHGHKFQETCGNSAENAQELYELTISLTAADFGDDASSFPSVQSAFMRLNSPSENWGTYTAEIKLKSFDPKKLRDYNQVDGFYQIPDAKYSFLLVATDASYKIRNGDPLAFDCDISGMPPGRMSCITLFPLMENVGIALTYINASQSELAHLRAFYNAVVRMVEGWRVSHTAEKTKTRMMTK